jgi:DNA-directed RNA polymerase subunit N (RpoN/RPB10)
MMGEFLTNMYEAGTDARPFCGERPIRCESIGRLIGENERRFQKLQPVEGCGNISHMFFRLGLNRHLRALCPYHLQRAVAYAVEKGTFSSDRCVPLMEGTNEWMVQRVMYD